MVTVRVDGPPRTVDVEADTPVHWMLRDQLRLTRTKFGAGVAGAGPAPSSSTARRPRSRGRPTPRSTRP